MVMNKDRTDRRNTKCSCGGTYIEATIYDDWEGKVTCSECRKRTDRYDPPEKINLSYTEATEIIDKITKILEEKDAT